MKHSLKLLILFISFIIACTPNKQEGEQKQSGDQETPTISLDDLEKYRPVFHFTPAENWINDPNGLVHYTGMQYFIGNFDGEIFKPDGSYEKARWLDYGKDFYAAVSYNNLPSELNPVLVGWVNNWRYANSIPTSPWRGMMSIPRELSLREVEGKLSLIQTPVTSIYSYITQFEKVVETDYVIRENDPLLNGISTGSYRMILDFENRNASEFGVELMRGGTEKTIVGYKVSEKELFINRKESGNISFHDAFPGIEYAPLSLENDKLKLDIIVDQSVVEVFANDGYRVITDQVFPENEEQGLKLYAREGEVIVTNLELYMVK